MLMYFIRDDYNEQLSMFNNGHVLLDSTPYKKRPAMHDNISADLMRHLFSPRVARSGTERHWTVSLGAPESNSH